MDESSENEGANNSKSSFFSKKNRKTSFQKNDLRVFRSFLNTQEWSKHVFEHFLKMPKISLKNRGFF